MPVMVRSLLVCAFAAAIAVTTGAMAQDDDAMPAVHQAAAPGTPATREAVARFYKALNAMFAGDAKPMAALWSRKPDVVYMGPDGRAHHGWLEVSADFDAAAKRKLGGAVEPRDITIAIGRDIAVVADIEVGKRNGRTNKVRATSAFRLEGGQWKMIAHHVDPLPTAP
ncbi:MAG TPA: nuclear transport factor 2 family protein [Stellaceae bacterium]|nr:nuclear transport factor 2 family protein [Stellaceae bacterium]